MRKNPLAVVLVLSGVFFVVFLVVAGIMMSNLTNKSPKKFFGTGNIAVVEVKGAISDSKRVVDFMEEIAEDPSIKGTIVRINSPGGAVAPSQEIYEAVLRLSKKMPVYSSMGSLAASGGYYVACGTKKIYANPGTATGSIGVIMQFADLSKLFQWAKVSPYSLKTGKFKDVGTPTREMSPEEKQFMQAMLENILGQFRRAVAACRNLPMEKVIELSDGRIFTGEQAKAAKLVDELGTFQDTVEALAKEVGIKGKPNLIYASKKRRFLDTILSPIDEEDESSSSSCKLCRLADAFVSGVTGKPAETSRSMVGPMFLSPYLVE